LRWTWLAHLGSAVLAVVVLWILPQMIREISVPRVLGVLATVSVALSCVYGVLQFSLSRIRRKLAAKAPGLCPACEYALEVTTATPADEPVRCPECGYQDTAQGVKAFWTRHLGEPLP
jgi:hypothetical protein